MVVEKWSKKAGDYCSVADNNDIPEACVSKPASSNPNLHMAGPARSTRPLLIF